MARMKVAHHNLRIESAPGDIESYALAAIDVLRRRYGQKVQFLTDDSGRFPRISELSRAATDVVVFEPKAWRAGHFRNVARVVEQDGSLYVVTPGTGRPLRTTVREISVEIESVAARHLVGRGEGS